MKKLSIIAAAALLAFSALDASAFSFWEISGAMMDLDGKDIRVASVDTTGHKHVYHATDKELAHGVYVVATATGDGTQVLPNTTALIRDYLRSRGMNVVDKPDGAGLAIKFVVGSLSIDTPPPAAGQPAAHGPGVAKGAELVLDAGLVHHITQTAGTFSGVLAYEGASSGHYEGTALSLSSYGVLDPTAAKLGASAEDAARDKMGVTAHTAPKKSDPHTTVADLLTLMTKVWADKYFDKG